jgi:hypothetical protein
VTVIEDEWLTDAVDDTALVPDDVAALLLVDDAALERALLPVTVVALL